ncbi:uncharacterized protein LOC144359470 [Saccoglossus kowalevskii]
MDSILHDYGCLSDGIDRFNPETFTQRSRHSFPMIREGLIQCINNAFSAVWTVRKDEKIRRIFESAYAVTESEAGGFIVSGDGINLDANTKPGNGSKDSDWPHLDQIDGRCKLCTRSSDPL